jgi:hypothetical protein
MEAARSSERFVYKKPHDATSQKTAFCILRLLTRTAAVNFWSCNLESGICLTTLVREGSRWYFCSERSFERKQFYLLLIKLYCLKICQHRQRQSWSELGLARSNKGVGGSNLPAENIPVSERLWSLWNNNMKDKVWRKNNIVAFGPVARHPQRNKPLYSCH